MHPGSTTTADELLAKFDSIYGVVAIRESVLAQFDSAHQHGGDRFRMELSS